MQTFFAQFEMLKMKEKDIANCFLRVDEIVNYIEGLGEIIEETSVVQKLMRTLPSWFNSRFSVLEDRSDLDNLTKYEQYGIITAYEMRMEPKNISRKEASFKATRNPKSSKNDYNNISNMSNEVEVIL